MEDKEMFEKVGVNPKELKSILKSKKKCESLRKVIEESKISFEKEIQEDVGKMIVQLGLTKDVEELPFRSAILKFIVESKITKKAQLTEAISYVKKVPEGKFSEETLSKECGVGVDLKDEEVAKLVGEYFSSKSKEEIEKDTSVGIHIRNIKDEFNELKFVDGKVLMNILSKQLCTKLGISSIKDLKKLKKNKSSQSKKPISSLHFKVRRIPIQKNSKKILEEHKKRTGGKIVTRFPPEPNGYLHIGHAKAMMFDFGYSQENGGKCYLRFDDTNPTKELPEFYQGIRDMVKWLGFKADYVTNASDYFDRLYGHAIELIKRGLAYIDFSTRKDIEKQRHDKIDSPYREKYTIEENLKLFEKMRLGYYKEGECCLRAKIDSTHDNPNMRDFVCYRIQFKGHSNPKIGNKWCVYPTYDFTHCLVDSYEDITHSICTLEFETRRESYFWLLDSLDLYKPEVWEFSRLNISRALLSKRKINRLVEMKVINSFDDPRLFTLVGLRRRGYTPEIIKTFCMETGASRVQQALVDVKKLEKVCGKILDKKSKRLFAVSKPLKILISNFEEKKYKFPNHPKNKKMGFREVPFEKVIFIEEEDFREVDDPNFFGLSINKTVGLRYGPNIHCTEICKDSKGNITHLKCTADYLQKEKPKGQLHWLGEENSTKCELRIYDYLLNEDVFTKEMTLEEPYINLNSETILKESLIEKVALTNKDERYQFERIGYFFKDYDSTEKNLVFNSILTLKESKEKKKLNK